MTLPPPKLYDLYDQVVVEMVELREVELARRLLREADALRAMQHTQPERHARLESLAGKSFFDVRDAYPDGSTRERRRAALAAALSAEVSVVPPGDTMGTSSTPSRLADACMSASAD
eukprot:gene11466-2361_t